MPLRRLVREALRMRPSRIIVGEVQRGESLDLLIAFNSGVTGLRPCSTLRGVRSRARHTRQTPMTWPSR